VGAVLHQKLQGFARTVEHSADLQSLGFTQRVAQFQAIGCGRLAGEEIIGQCTQGEDIEMLARVLRIRQRLRCHKRRGSIFDEPVSVGRGRPLSRCTKC